MSPQRTTPPGLLTLPLELHEKIFQHLPPFPDRFILRRVHPRLHFHIPKSGLPNLGHFQEKSRKKTLAIAELHYPCLIPLDHLPCYLCARMVPASQFIDKHKSRTRALGGKLCHERWCIHCGIDKKELSPGQLVTMDHVSRKRCYECGEFCYTGPELIGREFFEAVEARRAEKFPDKKVRAKRTKGRATQCIKCRRYDKKSGSIERGVKGTSNSKVYASGPSGSLKNNKRWNPNG